MKQPHPLYYLILTTHAFGCYLFYKGFFPVSTHVFLYGAEDVTIQQPSATYTHLIIMMIDAFRSDFIFSENDMMPYLSDLIQKNKTYSFRARGRPPTVTMPRIKALTSGIESDFSEILSNVASSEFQTDNILNKFKQSDFVMNFYGDDTWLKLFPKHFNRKDGTTSFVVSDYKEVDDNVTRHLDYELSAKDWNVMILHYLGLDHIGHLEGPYSHLIKPKLQEMDDIIKKISISLQIRSLNNKDERSLLLICGDHGMGETGSHGGASNQEIETPFIFIDSNDQGVPFSSNRYVNQVDLVSTLSLLFSLQIPHRNVGHPIHEFLNMYTADQQNSFKQILACQLYKNSRPLLHNEEIITRINTTCHNKTDFNVIDDVITRLQDLSPRYNDVVMFLGIFSSLVSAIVIILYRDSLFTCEETKKQRTDIPIPYIEVQHPHKENRAPNKENKLHHIGSPLNESMKYFSWICSLLYLISLFSSSFIEEEHYVWYYMTSSYFVLLFMYHLKRKSAVTELIGLFILLLFIRVCRVYNQTGVKWIATRDLSDWLSTIQHVHAHLVIFICSVLFIWWSSIRQENFLVQLLFTFGVFVITFYKIFTGTLIHLIQDYFMLQNNIPFGKIHNIDIILPRISYTIIFALYILYLLSYCNKSCTFWSLMCLLLLKVENISWFGMIVVIERLVTKYLFLSDRSMLGNRFHVYLMLIRFTYFSQGNSNSFPTIDISAGLIGFRDYHPIIANILTYIATYCASSYWICSWLDTFAHKKKYSSDVYDLIYYVTRFTIIEGVILMTVIYTQRFHLFIWSVFAPRLFYYIAFTVLYFSFVFYLLIKRILLKVVIRILRSGMSRITG